MYEGENQGKSCGRHTPNKVSTLTQYNKQFIISIYFVCYKIGKKFAKCTHPWFGQ